MLDVKFPVGSKYVLESVASILAIVIFEASKYMLFVELRAELFLKTLFNIVKLFDTIEITEEA